LLVGWWLVGWLFEELNYDDEHICL